MTVLIGYDVTVKVEINRSLLRKRTLGVERIHDLAGGGRALAFAVRCALIIVQRYRTTCGQGGGKSGDGKDFCDARAHMCFLLKSVTLKDRKSTRLNSSH